MAQGDRWLERGPHLSSMTNRAFTSECASDKWSTRMCELPCPPLEGAGAPPTRLMRSVSACRPRKSSGSSRKVATVPRGPKRTVQRAMKVNGRRPHHVERVPLPRTFESSLDSPSSTSSKPLRAQLRCTADGRTRLLLPLFEDRVEESEIAPSASDSLCECDFVRRGWPSERVLPMSDSFEYDFIRRGGGVERLWSIYAAAGG